MNSQDKIKATLERDEAIRKKFKELREQGMKVMDAVEIIDQDYPYLAFDSVRRLVYGVYNKNETPKI